MECKNTTTTLYINATGGTLPYDGTGAFTVEFGVKHQTVTDAHGCSDIGNINVTNGSGVSPAKPSSISSDAADVTGVCGNGNFDFSVSSTATATSYTWTAPSGSSISSTSNKGLNAVLTSTPGFNGGSISVTANNACGSSPAQTKSISTTPVKPGNVSGPAIVSSYAQNLVYSVPHIIGATFLWTLPGGATITSGDNTSTITVNWGKKQGNVNAKTVSNCGTSIGSNLNVSISGNSGSQSVMQSSNAEPATVLNAGLYPNPAQNVTYLVFNAVHEYKFRIELSDITGKQLQQKQGIAYTGRNQVEINLSGYAKGIYLITLINDKN